MTNPSDGTIQAQQLRWAVYSLLIAVAVGQWSGRILAVNTVDQSKLETYRIQQRMDRYRAEQEASGDDAAEIAERIARKDADVREKLRLQFPFLSANDRSRWVAIRALVERGAFEIDGVTDEPGWHTIDKVYHPGADGEPHYYSSKPPLSYVPQAGACWLLCKATGWSMTDDTHAVVRTLLILFNVVPFALLLVMIAALAERFCRTDWARMFLVASASFGTMLSAFAVTLNNHLPAAVAASVALYCWARIRDNHTAGTASAGWFVLAGLAAACTAANELPALAFLVAIGLSLLVHDPRRTLVWFAPAALVVITAFFATNYIAHQTLRPPYMHRSETNPAENWYQYPGSHWDNPGGIDAGEESKTTYALHTLVGHHGVFSMTPIWLLAMAGAVAWLFTGDSARRELAVGVLGLTVVVLVFYIGLRPQGDRNYGGMTNGLRWLFWLAPLWTVTMAPAADWAARSRLRQAFALVLLTFSTLSAAYPTWNPWTQPWVYRWMEWSGFDLLGS
jgi:hypothetical protein